MSTRSSATAAGQAGAAWAASSTPGMPRMAPGTGSITEHEPASMAREQRCALLCALVDADDREDAAALARVGWILFDLLCQVQQAKSEVV